MGLVERSGFTGLVTNAAESKAGPGALVEALNVVIRRPGCIEPRDGLVHEPNMLGTELWGFSYGQSDYVLREDPPFAYYHLDSATLLGNSPQPFRRDILTRAESRGNLYIPGADGVWRLLPGATAFERTGLVMGHELRNPSIVEGPPGPKNVQGLTGFASSTYLENAAGQGPVPAAQYWIAWMFFLHAVPVTAEALLSRGKGVHPTGTGYILSIQPTNYYFSQVISGVYYPDTAFPISAAHEGRMHLLVYSYGGGNGQLWFDGVAGASVAHAALPVDPADLTQWGNSKLFPTITPLQSATLITAASGTGPVTQAVIDQFLLDTKNNAKMTIPASMAVTRRWEFGQLPVGAPVGGQVPTLAGLTPSFKVVPTLWEGDPDPYPEEFWFPPGYHVGYQIVGYQKDANGLIRRSAPSQVYDLEYPGPSIANGAYVTVDVLDVRAVAYDTIEVYRSRVQPIGTRLDGEMQLVATIPGPYGTVVDKVPQENRGATLYTSPSRGGILEQNDPPPACACVASFKGSVFYGNTRGPGSLVYSFTWGGDVTGQATGIGDRTVHGTFTTGSDVVTGIGTADLIGIEPGQLVDIGFAQWFITAVGPSSITLNNVSTVTQNGAFTVSDRMWSGTNTTSSPGNAPANMIHPSFPAGFTYVLPDAVVTQITPPLDARAETYALSTISRAPIDAGYVVRATHGDEYSPPIAKFSDTPQPWSQDADPGKLMWSKPDEPEHVTPVAYAFVGERSKAILGLVPTRDALFVLKEDGIWRLTGTNATWRIDPFDPTTICVLPNSVRPLFGRGIFLSRKGVVCVGDGGVELVSGPVNDQFRSVVDKILTQFLSTGLYEIESMRGSFAAVFERDNEYTLITALSFPALVFNQNSGAWTRMQRADPSPLEVDTFTSVFNFGRSDRNVYALASGGYTTALANYAGVAASINRQYRADRDAHVTVSAYDPVFKIVTIPGIPWDVMAGDVLIDNAGIAWVATGGNTGDQVSVKSSVDVPMAIGPGTLHRSMHCRVIPASYMDPSSLTKHYRAIITAFPVLVGAVNVRVGFQSSMDPDFVHEDGARVFAPSGYAEHYLGYQSTALVPRAHARSWNLRAAIDWLHAFGDARLEAMFAESFEALIDSPTQAVGS